MDGPIRPKTPAPAHPAPWRWGDHRRNENPGALLDANGDVVILADGPIHTGESPEKGPVSDASGHMVVKLELVEDGLVRASASDGHWWEGPPDEVMLRTLRVIRIVRDRPAFFHAHVEDGALVVDARAQPQDW